MRIHLGHHFYGAGNLGDDFMLAGFLVSIRTLLPSVTFSSAVPFPVEGLKRRFPEIEWGLFDCASRAESIRQADVWLGLGGSPFQSAQSRWFIDHLLEEAASCQRYQVPMFYLGVGVQTAEELAVPEVRQLCEQSAGIWTRDPESAERLHAMNRQIRVEAASDLAHAFFAAHRPPLAKPGAIALVPNFDYASWPGMLAALKAIDLLQPSERIWLAQESRKLPGAEKALFAQLDPGERNKWVLVTPDESVSENAPLESVKLENVMSGWPSAEWLLTARFHAAIAGAWAGSKTVVITTNEKLRGIARQLAVATASPSASRNELIGAFQTASVPPLPIALAQRARHACEEFATVARQVTRHA